MRCILMTRLLKTTAQQMSEAHDLLVLRKSMQTWQVKLQKRYSQEAKTTGIFESRRLKRFLDTWRTKLHAKRQIQWRDSMRSRMKVVRLNREKKLKCEALVKWRQLHQSRLSSQYYSKRLLGRFLSCWKGRLARVDAVEDAGEVLGRVLDSRRVSKCWHAWKRASALRVAEDLLAQRVCLRVMSDVVAMWKKRM